MASEATNELGPSIDPDELRETAKNQQESFPREEQDTKESDLKDKRHRTRSEKGLQMDLDNARTKRDRAGNALKKQIEFVDDLLRQSKDIVLRDIWFVSPTGQACPEGRSTNRTQVLCEVLHPTLSRKTREIGHNTGNYVPYSFR